MEAVDLLDVRKVVVGHDAVIAGRGWFLDRIVVRVNVPRCCKRYVFPCGRLVAADSQLLTVHSSQRVCLSVCPLAYLKNEIFVLVASGRGSVLL